MAMACKCKIANIDLLWLVVLSFIILVGFDLRFPISGIDLALFFGKMLYTEKKWGIIKIM